MNKWQRERDTAASSGGPREEHTHTPLPWLDALNSSGLPVTLLSVNDSQRRSPEEAASALRGLRSPWRCGSHGAGGVVTLCSISALRVSRTFFSVARVFCQSCDADAERRVSFLRLF